MADRQSIFFVSLYNSSDNFVVGYH